MKIKVLGGHGGLAKGFATTSYLVDDELLIDAGAVASTLSVEEQARIDHILISHPHLDHIKDLAFICDNCFGMRPTPFTVHTHETVKNIILAHLLNDIVWPDFSKIPSRDFPTIRLESREPEKTFQAGKYAVTPVKVNHASDAMGFIVEREGKSVLFTLDTGPTERIWEIARERKNLKAIFTEVSFPNSLQRIADVSQHHTPQSMLIELQKMPGSIPVVLTHFKPNFREQILKELGKNDRLHVLERDGVVFNY